SHIVQDPEVPYVAFIPLAASQPEGGGDAYLELSDIRGTDFSGCRLAVLSGCGSGRGYVAKTATCPSLGDALIDAGVHAVVQTYCDVRDDAAAVLMAGFLDALQHGRDPVAALAVAQRDAARDGGDPAAWSAYSITLGTLVPEDARIP